MSDDNFETNQPEIFDPLSTVQELPEDYAVHYARNTVRNVVESYSGRMDAFAETIQNAMDALEERWCNWDPNIVTEDGGFAEHPTLRIFIRVADNEIEVVDNGTGVPNELFPTILVPQFSPKTSGATRGHKGVGTTFLAYGHPWMEFHTKVDGKDIGYRIEGGLQWQRNTSSVETAPKFKKQEDRSDSLADFKSGTAVRVGFGPNTTYGNLSSTIHNTPQLWAFVLRTYTAIGYINHGRNDEDYPAWCRELKVEINLSGVPRSGTAIVKCEFPYPHLGCTNHSACAELQSLQNQQSRRQQANLELLYVRRTHERLKDLLADQLRELENSDDESQRQKAELFYKFEMSVYASLTHTNTYYDQQVRRLAAPSADRFPLQNIDGGLQIASVHMPIGELLPHQNTKIKPERRRRYYIQVHLNSHYCPDLGRKTVAQQIGPTLQWLEHSIKQLLVAHDNRLVRDQSSATHHSIDFSSATQEVREVARQISQTSMAANVAGLAGLPVQSVPQFEPEVQAIFVSLISKNHLRGYKLRGIPGSQHRYDILFDYEIEQHETSMDANVVPLGIHAQHLQQNPLRRTQCWLELKIHAEDLISDFSLDDGVPSKKYFEHVYLAVVWEATTGEQGDFEIRAFDSTNWNTRVFFGATHFIEQPGNSHKVELISLNDLIEQLGERVLNA